MAASLLSVSDLTLGVRRRNRPDTRIVEDLSLEVAAGERFGIVGESGSGKSLTLRAVAGLLPRGVEVLSGSIRYDGRELVGMPAAQRRRLMGPEIAMVFQEPMTALNPVVRVGDQIAEGPGATSACRRPTPPSWPSRRWPAPGSRTPSGGRAPTRTNCPAGCASAS